MRCGCLAGSDVLARERLLVRRTLVADACAIGEGHEGLGFDIGGTAVAAAFQCVAHGVLGSCKRRRKLMAEALLYTEIDW